jgi:hypothetical protein
MHCSPERSNVAGSPSSPSSCYTNKELREILKEKNIKDRKVVGRAGREALVDAVYRHLKATCGSDQRCWSRGTNVDPKRVFKPRPPRNWKKNPRQWVTNHDIEDCITQYEAKYPSFMFMGVLPDDFVRRTRVGGKTTDTCVGYERHDWCRKVPRGPRFGAVFNIDCATSSGSHWVSMFGCYVKSSPQYGLFYYDSAGDPPSRNVVEFMTRVRDHVDDPAFKIGANSVQHQFENHECGIYSLFFMVSCLVRRHASYRTIMADMPGDEKMNAARPLLFSM